MPRKVRVEYAGAIYHVMCRGNRRQDVFRDARDNELFLDTLGEACARCGWRVHAYVLMGNHYHMLLETPEANLVAGMQWLQGTYTKRFNVRHKEWGHLFQGRYKALLIEGAKGYFAAAAAYIHLNPARMKGYDFARQKLEQYSWSSYPGYLRPGKRRKWLCVDRVLNSAGLGDTPLGRQKYRRMMEKRMLEMQFSAEPWKVDEAWNHIRRGWCFGDKEYREEMAASLGGIMKSRRRESFSGPEIRRHDEQEAERWVVRGLKALGLKEKALAGMKKNCPEKYAVAWLVRRNSCVRNQWIKDRLYMGKATNFSELLKRMEKREFGASCFDQLKNIN